MDAIARNAAKLKPMHVINRVDCEKVPGSCQLNRLLQVQPNPHMSAYDFLYKVTSQYFERNNAFVLIVRSEINGAVTGLYPIVSESVEALSDDAGTVYYRFNLKNGKQPVFCETELIHLRRNYNQNELFGSDNSAIFSALELSHAQQDGIVQGIKTGATVRGVLKGMDVVGEKNRKQMRDDFVSDYLSMSNNGGVIVIDSSQDYVPITSQAVTVDDKQLSAVKDMIYSYLGVSENIVTSKYTEDEWAAFYESILEPLALQMSLEFTRKMLTERERSFGNEIEFQSSRLQFSNYRTKAQIVGQMLPYGILTTNQVLDIFDMPRVADGDVRLTPLNMTPSQNMTNAIQQDTNTGEQK